MKENEFEMPGAPAGRLVWGTRPGLTENRRVARDLSTRKEDLTPRHSTCSNVVCGLFPGSESPTNRCSLLEKIV